MQIANAILYADGDRQMDGVIGATSYALYTIL